jgi:hypothetical protein
MSAKLGKSFQLQVASAGRNYILLLLLICFTPYFLPLLLHTLPVPYMGRLQIIIDAQVRIRTKKVNIIICRMKLLSAGKFIMF